MIAVERALDLSLIAFLEPGATDHGQAPKQWVNHLTFQTWKMGLMFTSRILKINIWNVPPLQGRQYVFNN
jgi:hypothetical protein